MPLSPNFSISQSAINPAVITAVDTSTGSDVAITGRRIYFQTNTGTYLVESGTTTDYEVWPLADVTDSFNVLSQDQALAITVQWVNSGGTVLYTLTQVFCCAEFNKQFFYYLIQQQALTYTVIQDSVYYSGLAAYWVNITSAIQAIEIGADIAASQACLDRATYMKSQQTLFFGQPAAA